MISSLRNKLVLGFGGLLTVIAVMALLTVQQIDRLGSAIDVILKQNYRSVRASQSMKEALEKMESELLFSFSGRHEASMHNLGENERKFREALSVELGNITLPGEKEKAERISELFDRYASTMHGIMNDTLPPEQRKQTYFTTLLPLLNQIGLLAQEILDMNQANMDKANEEARTMAASAHNRILTAIIACAAVTLLFSFQSRRWILVPIRRLIESANQIRNGNLDLVIEPETHDEIGQLSEAFNEMASTLRSARRRDDELLYRTRRATQEVMDILPTPIAIFDREGRVDVATRSASRLFGLLPGSHAEGLDHPWLPELLQRAEREGRAVESGERGYLQKFIDNREFFFMPAAVPIPPLPDSERPTGTVLLLYDMTQVHEQKELKRDVVSTVSHQLRTPLTSVRMAIHLLLEQRIGPLNEQQAELLGAAGEESGRLSDILDDLLDLNRFESGKGQLNLRQQTPESLLSAGIEPFVAEAKSRGVSLIVEVPPGLPPVTADTTRIGHVFANLLSNALRFSPDGGSVTVRAEKGVGGVRFSVEDSGEGIAPEHLKRLFEQFYRVPGQDERSGIGLGLSIVREIVRAHGGSVGVESTRGRGSLFHFTLPL